MVKQKMIRQARNEYYRRYRLNNPEKIQAITQRFWERQAQALEYRSMPDAEQQPEANDNI